MPLNWGDASRGCLHELPRHGVKLQGSNLPWSLQNWHLFLVSYTFYLLFHVSLQEKWKVEVQGWRDIDQKTQIGQECDMTWGSPWLGFRWWPGGNDHQEETDWHHRWWCWGLIRAQSTKALQLPKVSWSDWKSTLCTEKNSWDNGTVQLCWIVRVRFRPSLTTRACNVLILSRKRFTL